MYYILYPYKKVSQREENVISKIIRKTTHIYSTVPDLAKQINLCVRGPGSSNLCSWRVTCTRWRCVSGVSTGLLTNRFLVQSASGKHWWQSAS